ncbi:MAG: arsenate reductase, glutathione/glutaredoxin type [Cyanobacteria bacterium]|nr:arsenate reductase, glutathione/glutaredoxin type [Cyanobacteriota bacterium]
MKRILFVCKKNSRRSQMAEGFAKQMAGDRAIVASAGLAGSEIDPLTVEVMAEVGVDIADQRSQPLSDFSPEQFNVVISLCGCGVNLPPEWLETEQFEDWNLEDPEGGDLDTFRTIRDQVYQRVAQLLAVD